MQPPSDGASESAKIWYTVNWLPLLYSLLFIDTVVVGWRGGRWGGRQLAAGHWSLLISKCQCPPPPPPWRNTSPGGWKRSGQVKWWGVSIGQDRSVVMGSTVRQKRFFHRLMGLYKKNLTLLYKHCIVIQ